VQLNDIFSRTRVSARALARTAAIIAAVALGLAASASAHDDGNRQANDTIVFTVDVAEDFALFNPTFVRPTDTQPERGSFFVTEGNISSVRSPAAPARSRDTSENRSSACWGSTPRAV
jgi:hypothetical protein